MIIQDSFLSLACQTAMAVIIAWGIGLSLAECTRARRNKKRFHIGSGIELFIGLILLALLLYGGGYWRNWVL